MFVATADEIIGDTDVTYSIAAIGHYVNKEAIHRRKSEMRSLSTLMGGFIPALQVLFFAAL
ncbi:MAG TPA: hypothetical protein VLU23_20360 [Pseudolabrys sp.]|nr:hypothetical protein [Pseudolabrys sp.]